MITDKIKGNKLFVIFLSATNEYIDVGKILFNTMKSGVHNVLFTVIIVIRKLQEPSLENHENTRIW